ncbi:MAG: OPT/YSL family transporter [Sphaerochaetaceae bacterium]|nr:OPT/YSL family transporter [Sphaerochaetaceae bacterium]
MQENRQLTLRGALTGILGLLIITTSSMYIALKMGALPWPTIFVTVLSMVVLGKAKNSTLQEINVTHTLMSAGAMVAGGVAFTIPGLWIINPQAQVPFLSILIMTVCGAVLGTLLSALYRKNLIVEQKLDYPIGNAAYNTITTGLNKGKDSIKLFVSMGFSAIFTFARDLFGWIPSVVTIFGGSAAVSPIALYISPMALAIGTMIGKVFAILWFGGAILGFLVICPVGVACGWFSDLAVADLFRQNLGLGLLIGTGVAVFIKAIISTAKKPRAERKFKLSSKATLSICFILVLAAILMAVGTEMNLLQAILAIIGVCLACLLSGMITGMSGINPMEVFGILVLLLIQVIWNPSVLVLFLTAGLVTVACGLSGDVMNDLKSGYMLKTDPKQQILAEGIGGIIGAVISVCVLFVMKKSFGGFGTAELPAPQASAVAAMASGLGASWEFYAGIAIGLVLFLFNIPASAIGLGIYLPMYLSSIIGLGYLLSYIVKKITKISDRDANLISSGLLGGEGIAGVICAIIAIFA